MVDGRHTEKSLRHSIFPTTFLIRQFNGPCAEATERLELRLEGVDRRNGLIAGLAHSELRLSASAALQERTYRLQSAPPFLKLSGGCLLTHNHLPSEVRTFAAVQLNVAFVRRVP